MMVGAFRPASARPDSALTAGCCSGAGGDPIMTEDVERLDWVAAALARPSVLAAASAACPGTLGGPAGARVALLRELASWPPPARPPRPLVFGTARPDRPSRPTSDLVELDEEDVAAIEAAVADAAVDGEEEGGVADHVAAAAAAVGAAAEAAGADEEAMAARIPDHVPAVRAAARDLEDFLADAEVVPAAQVAAAVRRWPAAALPPRAGEEGRAGDGGHWSDDDGWSDEEEDEGHAAAA